MNGRFAKSFWIFCAASSLVLAVTGGADAGRKRVSRDPAELTNFLLSPSYSQWLVGAVARIASEREIDAYLKLSDDAAAEAFIDDFWNARRSPEIVWPSPQPRAQFESRAQEADSLFSEGTHLGRRSDRGTIHILYGAPDSKAYETSTKRNRASFEVWTYPKGAQKGLDGERPKREYFFIKKDDKTVFHVPGARLGTTARGRN